MFGIFCHLTKSRISQFFPDSFVFRFSWLTFTISTLLFVDGDRTIPSFFFLDCVISAARDVTVTTTVDAEATTTKHNVCASLMLLILPRLCLCGNGWLISNSLYKSKQGSGVEYINNDDDDNNNNKASAKRNGLN